MYPLFETIKIQQNELLQTAFHNERVNRTRQQLFGSADKWDIADQIILPELDMLLTYRCRFLYGQNHCTTEFIPYQPRHIKKLYLVNDNLIDYSFKYTNRQKLEGLRTQLPGLNNEADVLIVKNGLINDTSYANIAFYDGSMWYTPETPLLKGTKRAYYLSTGAIAEKKIRPGDLKDFLWARLINAMIDLESTDDIPIHNICI